MHKPANFRARNGLLSILISRPFSALAGLITLLLLSRVLSPKEYSMYFALWAAVEIVLLASNLGLMHAAYRYIQGQEGGASSQMIVFGPVRKLVALRCVALFVGVAVFLVLPVSILGPVEQGSSRAFLIAFALVTFFEGAARYVELVFESLLLQGYAQQTMLLRAVLRPVGIGTVMLFESVSIEIVLIVEVLSCGLSAFIAGLLLWGVLRKSSLVENRTRNGDAIHLPRILRFVLPAFATQVLGLIYGPDVLKLILNGGGDSTALATFGFAFSLAAMVQRYLPVAILGGLFRPLFVAAVERKDAQSALVRLVSVTLILNLFAVAIPFLAISPNSVKIASVFSGGNYPESGPVLMILLIGTAFFATHGVLSLYCLALEQSRIPLLATFAAVCSLPVSVGLASKFGAVGIAFAWAISELVWISFCGLALAFSGRFPKLPWQRLSKIPLIAASISIVSTLGSAELDEFSMGLTVIAPVLLLFTCMRTGIFGRDEIDWLSSVIPLRLHRLLTRFSE